MKKIFAITLLTVTVWSCSHKITPPPPPTTAATPVEQGKATYINKCGTCHKLKNTADYTVAQWAPILDHMAKKAQLDPTEKANVLAYVDANAKP
jgi:hypothetical protein